MKEQKSDLHVLELFTQRYKEHQNDHYALRDLRCLESQYPAIFLSVQKGDLFAGRISYLPVGFRPTSNGDGNVLHYSINALRKLLKTIESKDEKRVQAILDFWESQHDSLKTTEEKRFPNTVLDRFNVSMERLINRGIQGLLEDIQDCRIENITTSFYELANYMVESLELLKQTCLAYANDIRREADECGCEKNKCKFLKIAVALESLTDQPPSNSREALQLLLLFAMMSGRRNLGNLSKYIQPFVDRDLNLGITSEGECKQMIFSFIDLMNEWIPGQIDEFNDLITILPSYKKQNRFVSV